MTKTIIKIFGWLILLLTLTACGTGRPDPPQAQAGEIDLSAWRFERDGPINLAGEWDFYWQRLLTSAEIAAEEPTQVVALPDWWNGYKIADEKLSGMGYATYHLRVKLPPTADNLALDLPEFETAYRLYIDATLIAQNGRVGATPATTIPAWRPQIASFDPPDDANHEYNLILQIANFHHRKGGAGQIIRLGTAEQLLQQQMRHLALTFLLLGGLIMMGLYHLGIHLLRPQMISAAYFGLICLLMTIRLLVSGEYYATHYWPRLPWATIVRLNYLSFSLTVPLFASFARRLFPEEVPRWLLRVLTASIVCYAALILLTPPRIFTHVLPAYQVLSILATIIMLIQIIQAARQRRQGALVFLIGFLILVTAMINDILHNNHIIHTAFIGPIGAFLFIFFQAYLLAERFTTVFVEMERLSRELEARVAQRTQELAHRNESLREVNAELSQEIARRERAEAQLRSAKDAAEAANQAKSTFLGKVSHELRTPLNAIHGFTELMLMDDELSDIHQEHLGIILTSSKQLLELINQILTFSRTAGAATPAFEISEMKEKSLRRLQPSPADATRSLSLADTPVAWRQALHQAAIEGDMTAMQEIIDQIHATRSDLAAQLRYLVDNFQHDQILELIAATQTPTA
ncbi:MAG: sensor histidine kinase [Anaerolineales bacterium]